MLQRLRRVFDRTFWIGLACGVLLGGALVWRLDLRAAPSSELQDARRASITGKWEVVRSVLGRYLRRFPEDPEARILLARALAAQGDFSGCLEQLAKVDDESDWSGEARLREAQAHLINHFGARAERSYLRAIELASRERGNQQIVNAARLGLAQICSLEARYSEARELMLQLLASVEDSIAILSVLLDTEALGQEPHTAIESLQRFLQNDPQDFEARRALGHHHAVLGKLTDARPMLEACMREQPQNLSVAESLAQCLIDLPDLQACERLLDDIESVADEKGWYWRIRGYLSEQNQDWMTAALQYQHAARLSPNDPVVQHLFGTVLNRLGESDRGGEHLQRASQLRTARQQLVQLQSRLMSTGAKQGGPGPDPDLCYLIGSTCQTIGLPEAEDWFREALARDPYHSPSRTALENLEQQKAADAEKVRADDVSGAP